MRPVPKRNAHWTLIHPRPILTRCWVRLRPRATTTGQLAAEHFDEVVSGSSVSADARWAHACLYLLPLGRLHESVDQMQRAVDQDPLNVGWRGVLGSLLNATEQYDRALEELRKALDLDENHIAANFVIGETYWRLGRFAEAAAAAETAHRLVPSHSMGWGLLAAVLSHEGERDRAAALIAEHADSPIPVWGRVWYQLLWIIWTWRLTGIECRSSSASRSP